MHCSSGISNENSVRMPDSFFGCFVVVLVFLSNCSLSEEFMALGLDGNRIL